MTSTDSTSAAAQLAAAQAQQAADDAAIANAMATGDMGGDDAASPATPDTPLTRNLRVNSPADEPSGLRDDDFGLDGDLPNMLASALEERFKDKIDADTATPDPAQTSPASAPGEDGAGGGGPSGEDAAPDPTPASAPDPSSFSLDTYARDYFGVDLTRQQAQDLFGVLGRLQTATPEERQYIDAVLSGRVPTGQPPAQQPSPISPPNPQPGMQPIAQPGLTLPPRPDDEYAAQIYDTLAPSLQQLAANQQAIQAEIDRNTQQQLLAQQQAQSAQIESAATEWRKGATVLTDGEFDSLINRTAQSGIFPGLLAAHRGDAIAATRAALDQTFWADEGFRTRAMANVASGRQALNGDTDPTSAIAADQQQLDQGRRALASSVAGGGGSAVTRDPTPPTTTAGRKSAMLNEIAAAMSNPSSD